MYPFPFHSISTPFHAIPSIRFHPALIYSMSSHFIPTIPHHLTPNIPHHSIPSHSKLFNAIPYYIPYYSISCQPYYTIPFQTIPYHPILPFRTIPFHIPFHLIPCPFHITFYIPLHLIQYNYEQLHPISVPYPIPYFIQFPSHPISFYSVRYHSISFPTTLFYSSYNTVLYSYLSFPFHTIPYTVPSHADSHCCCTYGSNTSTCV